MTNDSLVVDANLDPANIVNYYDDACDPGEFISDIADDGTFTCSAPAGTAPTAGNDIDVTGYTVDLEPTLDFKM
jgi:hypothetical protein